MIKHDQPVLPGLEFVGSASLLEEFATGVNALDEAELAKRAAIQHIQETQDEAWDIYCNQTVALYAETWNLAASFARDVPPIRFEPTTTTWRFDALAPTEAGTVALTTTLSLTHGEEEFKTALEYLRHPVSGRHCPEQLFGVAAEGSGRNRAIPVKQLALAYGNRGIERAYYLGSEVHAAVPGSLQPAKQLYALSMGSDGRHPNRDIWAHQPVWHSTAAELLRLPFHDDHEQLLAAILNSLDSPQTRQHYATLQRINEILAISAPEVNGAPEMVPPPTILAATLRYQTS